jgi:ABC-type phosphate transport system substrate-binding protein
LVLALLATSIVRRAAADGVGELRIIVHPDNRSTTLARDFVADLYLKRVTRWTDGELARPADQRAGTAVREAFSEGVLKRSVAAMKRYWQQRIFSGRELPPPELDSDEAVVEFVQKHRGAIGYVSGAAKLQRAKPITLR